MNDQKAFSGIYSAIFSVYDENLNVKKEAVKKLVDYQLDNGIKGFYVGGNTGECTVLPAKTRKQMLDAVIEANAGRGQIMAHIGAGHFDEVVDLLEDANGKKIDAIASLPPSLTSYYKEDEIIEYYTYLAKHSKVPVYAYVTGVLGCNLYDFACKISKVENIAGIKMSIPDYFTMNKITALNNGKINVLNGPDETMICGLSVGADGAIGTSYNICPKLACGIYDAFKRGDIETARAYQTKLNGVINVALGKNLDYWKSILRCMGFDMGITAFPQKNTTNEELKDLKEKLDAIDFFNML